VSWLAGGWWVQEAEKREKAKAKKEREAAKKEKEKEKKEKVRKRVAALYRRFCRAVSGVGFRV
jgi:hypothetical protein